MNWLRWLRAGRAARTGPLERDRGVQDALPGPAVAFFRPGRVESNQDVYVLERI
jgi:hypothetical protein